MIRGFHPNHLLLVSPYPQYTLESPPSNLHAIKLIHDRSDQIECTKTTPRVVYSPLIITIIHSLQIRDFNLLSLLRTLPLRTTIFVSVFVEIETRYS
ncbi:hypothetical protein L1987_76333 [Smallanthus sonchifolius]|uniref:Uncharacterized protein n=1 Tax=Smallanthus sonchifolius TaxID=185202 RepID=A0ACB9A892_9ASTR|nr:hypothetical protein L1987_76333 [Smallanthus sonchifolius]